MKTETPITEAALAAFKSKVTVKGSTETDLIEATNALVQSMARLERTGNKLREALKPFADLLDGHLESVGGGTLIAPTIKVQNVKDAHAALSNDPSSAAGADNQGHAK